MVRRDDNSQFPGVKGIWFKVIDKDGNDVDLTPYSPQPVQTDQNGIPTQIVVDDQDSSLGWYPTSPFESGNSKVSHFKSVILNLDMGINNLDSYDVYDINSNGPLDDPVDMDFNILGLKKDQPLTMTEQKEDTTENENDGGGDKGNNDDKANDNDNPVDGEKRAGVDKNDGAGGDDKGKGKNDDKGTGDDDKSTKNSDDEDKGGARKSKSRRDSYPGLSGVKGFWFEVIDINGNSLDLSRHFPTWDKAGSQTDLAWLRIKGTYTALQLKKRVLGKLSLKIGKYDVYNDGDDSVPYDDNSGDVDLDNNGLKKNKPLVFKERQNDESNESDGSTNESSGGSVDDLPPPDYPSRSNNSSSGSVDELPPPDNPDYIGNVQQVSNQAQEVYNADPYRFFNKRIQCTSNADWSRYEGSIQDTYPGEILWTDGNLSYGVANMMAYMAVRRVPNSPEGAVVAVGRAANEPAYFVYLG